MRKTFTAMALFSLPMLLSACGSGAGIADITLIYGAAALLSLALLVSCCCMARTRSIWFVVLFSSVLVVNSGYFLLSVSQSLEGALWANRLSYLGSVFLPLSMLMIILRVTGLHYKKWLPPTLLALAAAVFLVAASPGILDIYYKEVTLDSVRGASVLNKVYGPWHCLYLFYLLGYFGVMVAAVVHAIAKKCLESTGHAVMLAIAVFVNLAVWMLEQLVELDLEILSVSYIISELFLLGLYILVQEQQHLREQLAIQTAKAAAIPAALPAVEVPEQFSPGLRELTPTERLVYNAYLDGKSTKQVMEGLSIKENTLKFHNKNLYAKLGVNSRKQLVEIGKALERME